MLDPIQLLSFFYEDSNECCEIEKATELPTAYRSLLDHDDHMTVTVEAFHDSLVDVEVLEHKTDEQFYSRQILLKRRSDGCVVQFGIVRLTLELVDQQVRDEIITGQTPLGRILIKHHVMRRVELDSIWKVIPGAELRRHFGSESETYGRTAWIHVNGQPAIELLEIVAPVTIR